MSALYLSIVMVGTILLLKNMFTASVLTLLALVPAIDFHRTCNRRFKPAYMDIGLMQAGLINESNKKRGVLESWADETEKFNEKERFRAWLVDGKERRRASDERIVAAAYTSASFARRSPFSRFHPR